jgi:hypothetical protein
MAVRASQIISKLRASVSIPVLPRLVRLAILIAVDASVAWLLNRLVSLGYLPLAAAIFIIVVFVNIVLLRREAYPVRWMVVGLVFMALFTIYPIFFTVWVSFTNYGEGHLVTEEQAIDQLLRGLYLPEGGRAYTWTAFESAGGDYALWLKDAEGNGFLATPGEPLTQPQPGEMGIGEFDDNGVPETIEGYQRLNAIVAATNQNLTEILFGEAGKTIQIRSPSEAAELLPLYVYDSDQPGDRDRISEHPGYILIAGWHSAPTGFHCACPGRQFQRLLHQPRPARAFGPDHRLELRIRPL